MIAQYMLGNDAPYLNKRNINTANGDSPTNRQEQENKKPTKP